jgi:BTB/POZ domain-containing protein KCTD9
MHLQSSLLVRVALATVLAIAIGAGANVPRASAQCDLRPHGSCVGADLTGRDLSNRDLSNIDLHLSNLDRANLSNTSFNNANLRDVTMKGADLGRTKFEGADLWGSQLNGARLSDTRMVNLKGHHVNFQNTDLLRTNFDHADLTGSNFYGASFRHTHFTHVTVPNASFTGASFESVNANGTDFLHTNLNYQQFRVNVDAAREYYTTRINMHINYYGKCKEGSAVDCRSGIGSCTTTSSASDRGSCGGLAEFTAHAHGFTGVSGMIWDTTLNGMPHMAHKNCPASGLGMDRNLYVDGSEAWLCGLIDRKWYWAILREGSLRNKSTARMMRSGIDPSKPGEPGGAMKLYLGYADASASGYNGFVLDLQGWVHIPS